jgi:hypothetical protein
MRDVLGMDDISAKDAPKFADLPIYISSILDADTVILDHTQHCVYVKSAEARKLLTERLKTDTEASAEFDADFLLSMRIQPL